MSEQINDPLEGGFNAPPPPQPPRKQLSDEPKDGGPLEAGGNLMLKSTNLIGDMNTVITAGPSVTTQANALAAAGPIMDYVGNCQKVRLKLKEAYTLLGLPVGAATYGVKGVTDSTDATNLGLINGVIAALTGGGSPSTQLLADMTSVITNGPNAATQAKAIAAGGEIMDYLGNCKLALLMLEEAKVLINGPTGTTGVAGVTSASDDNTNKVLLQNIALALV